MSFRKKLLSLMPPITLLCMGVHLQYILHTAAVFGAITVGAVFIHFTSMTSNGAPIDVWKHQLGALHT